MNTRTSLIVSMTFLGIITPAITYAETANKIQNLIQPDRSSYTKETKITDPNRLFKELENYDSYRPDSYSDLVRNPFGNKRYKNLKFIIKNQN